MRRLDACKSSAKDIAAQARAIAGSRFPSRLAFVGYRDINDDTAPQDPWRFKVVPFTVDADAMHAALADVRTGGLGLDVPEDVEGGLQKAADLEWKYETRLVVHYADAPGHGLAMHDASVYDEFPAEGGGAAAAAAALAETGVDYFLVQLDPSMDATVTVLRQAYDAVDDKRGPMVVLTVRRVGRRSESCGQPPH